MKIKLILTFVVFVMMMNSCSLTNDVEELSRLCSPDNQVEAILHRAGGGATSDFAYSVFIVKKGAVILKKDNSLFLADGVENLKIAWQSDRILVISYEEARIFQFTNFWHSRDVQNFQYVVELKLMPANEGHSLSKRDRFLERFDMPGEPINSSGKK